MEKDKIKEIVKTGISLLRTHNNNFIIAERKKGNNIIYKLCKNLKEAAAFLSIATNTIHTYNDKNNKKNKTRNGKFEKISRKKVSQIINTYLKEHL